MKSYFLLSIFCVMLIGCSGSKNTTASSTTKDIVKTTPASVLINDTWLLEMLNNNEVIAENYIKERPKLEIKAADKIYTGYSGCNNFSGTLLELTDFAIQFNPGPITRMACMKDDIESAFLRALSNTKTYTIDKGKLYLIDEKAKIICVFQKVD